MFGFPCRNSRFQPGGRPSLSSVEEKFVMGMRSTAGEAIVSHMDDVSMAARASRKSSLDGFKKSPRLAAVVDHDFRTRQYGPDIADLFFDVFPSTLLAVDEGDDPFHVEPRLACRLDGRQGRSAGG